MQALLDTFLWLESWLEQIGLPSQWIQDAAEILIHNLKG